MEITGEKKLIGRRIMIYLAVTFVVTYGVEIFLIMPMAGSADEGRAYLAQALVAGVMFIPAAAALAARLITGEKLSGSGLMLAPHFRGNLKYYGIAWFGVLALILFGAALYFLIFPGQFDGNMGYVRVLLEAQAKMTGMAVTEDLVRQTVIMQAVMGILLSPFLNFINCFGEEWGWRGYLLPLMLERLRIGPTLLLSGVIWGLWHAPLIIMGHNYGLGYRGYPVTGILAMCFFCIVIGTLLSFVTIRTGSCIPAVIGHGTINGFSAIGLCFTSLEKPYNVFLGPAPTGLVGGFGFLILAVFLFYLLRKEEKQKNSQNVLPSEEQSATIQKN